MVCYTSEYFDSALRLSVIIYFWVKETYTVIKWEGMFDSIKWNWNENIVLLSALCHAFFSVVYCRK